VPILHALLTLIGLALLLATLPLVLELLILSIAAAHPPRTISPSDRPIRLAALIPAHNEQQLIASCVASLRAASPPSLPIYVIAHNCTDATAERAAAAGATVLPLDDTIGGKGTALHFGFTQALAAGAEAVLVIDADSTVSSNLTQAVAQAVASGSAAVQCRYVAANPETTPRTRLLALALLGMNVLRPRGRTRLGLSCGIFGNGFALTADTLRSVPYLANSVVEDREYHLHLLRAGLRVDFLDHATVHGELPTASPATATQRERWEGGRILMRRRWTLPLVRHVLSGRIRMLEPLADLLSLPLATAASLLCVCLLLPLIWLRLYAAFGLATFILYVLVAATFSPSPVATLRALVSAPAYLVWKLLMIPRTRMAARADAAWVRTERNQPPLDTQNSGSPAPREGRRLP
jgi:cellulose synthase/poly-beta-1,6-N-acetylglucosamine synthase-like glycosyltransferase